MQRTIISSLVASLAFGICLIGCGDRTVRSSESQSRNPITGNITHKEENVKERPDGSTYKESNRTTVNP